MLYFLWCFEKKMVIGDTTKMIKFKLFDQKGKHKFLRYPNLVARLMFWESISKIRDITATSPLFNFHSFYWLIIFALSTSLLFIILLIKSRSNPFWLSSYWVTCIKVVLIFLGCLYLFWFFCVFCYEFR